MGNVVFYTTFFSAQLETLEEKPNKQKNIFPFKKESLAVVLLLKPRQTDYLHLQISDRLNLPVNHGVITGLYHQKSC